MIAGILDLSPNAHRDFHEDPETKATDWAQATGLTKAALLMVLGCDSEVAPGLPGSGDVGSEQKPLHERTDDAVQDFDPRVTIFSLAGAELTKVELDTLLEIEARVEKYRETLS